MHTGPFRVTAVDPGVKITFEAYERYFLGKPKLDVIHVRIYGNQDSLLAAILAGEAQVSPAVALTASFAADLEQRWRESGEGTVHVKDSGLYFLDSQWRQALQMEPAVLEPKVRAALLHALDRESLSDALVGGKRERAARSLLSESHPLFEAAQDSLLQFTYSPDRAKSLLREAGWVPGPGGMLRHSRDGRPFRTSIWSAAQRVREGAAYASFWRAMGIEVEEFAVPAARERDRALRAQFPGWESTGAKLTDTMGASAANAENGWTSNRSGYDNPEAKLLAEAFRSALTLPEQLRTMRAIVEFFNSELTMLPLYHNVQYTGVAKE